MGNERSSLIRNLLLGGGLCALANFDIFAQELVVTTGTHLIEDGDSYSIAFALGDSTIDMTGGEVTDGIAAIVNGTLGQYTVFGASAASFDLATFNMYTGYVASAQSHGFGTFNLYGGEVDGFAQSFGNSTFNMGGGEVLTVRAFENSTYDMTGGRSRNTVDAHDSSVVRISGGSVRFFVDSWESSTLFFSGGAIEVADLGAHDSSQLYMSGGYVPRWGEARDQSTFTLSGGTLEEGFTAFDQSSIFIEAYSFTHAGGAFDFGGGTELTILPSDPLFSGITDPFGTGFDWRVLSGLSMLYADGTTGNFNFYAYADDTNFPSGGGFAWDGTLTLRLIPAPSGLAFLGFAAIGASRRRRRD